DVCSSDLSGNASKDVLSGQLVTVQVGEHSYTTAVQATGTWSLQIPGAVLAQHESLTVSITVTDQAGNSTTRVQTPTYKVDLAAPEVTIAVDPITSDNVVNLAESQDFITVSGRVKGEVKADDLVTVQVGGETLTAVVDVEAF